MTVLFFACLNTAFLILFKLLSLRKELEKSRSIENMVALKNLIEDDIIKVLADNYKLNNITISDARKLKWLTYKLYKHLYFQYEELNILNDIIEDILTLDMDYIENEYEEKVDVIKNKANIKIKEIESHLKTEMLQTEIQLQELEVNKQKSMPFNKNYRN